MAWLIKATLATALIVLPNATAEDQCLSSARPCRASSLLQKNRTQGGKRVQTSLVDGPDNGIYVLPPKPQRLSELEQLITRDESAGDPPVEMQEILNMHNLYRCMHGVPLLTWDSALAANAQAWADNGIYGHSETNSGENVAWGYPTRSGKETVMGWYSEIQFTDGTPKSCQDTVANSQEDICHYTQVVWKASTKLGCGHGKATVKNLEGDFWVCQYLQPGNYGSAFTANVLAPQKTEEECASEVPLPPAPTPVPAPPPGCEDGAVDSDPVIMMSDGSKAACAEIAWACEGYHYVKEKCKMSCNAC